MEEPFGYSNILSYFFREIIPEHIHIIVHVAGILFLKELSMFLSFISPNIETVFKTASFECLFRMAALLFLNYQWLLQPCRIASIFCSSSTEKVRFLRVSTLSSICCTELAPIRTEVIRLSRKTHASAIWARL